MKIIKMPVSLLNPGQLHTAASNLLTRLAANATDFPSPPITDLTAHKTALNTQLGELASLEAQVIAKGLEIEATCALVRTDMNNLGEWLEGVTQDLAKLSEVAELRAARTPAGPTPRVMHLRLSFSASAGAVHAAWDSLYKHKVKSYEVQTVLNPLNNDSSAAAWTHQQTVTKASCALTGFTPGARIWVRVRAVGRNGSGDWSDPDDHCAVT